MFIAVDINAEDLVHSIGSYSNKDVFEFIKKLELRRGDLELTEMLRDYFVEAMMSEEIED